MRPVGTADNGKGNQFSQSILKVLQGTSEMLIPPFLEEGKPLLVPACGIHKGFMLPLKPGSQEKAPEVQMPSV